jgi:hypothetical protein
MKYGPPYSSLSIGTNGNNEQVQAHDVYSMLASALPKPDSIKYIFGFDKK